MKLPRDSQRLTTWSRELIDQCLVSRENRRLQSRQWRQLYYTGSLTGTPSKYNRCFSHVDKLSSYIYSPADVRFSIEFEGDQLPIWDDKTRTAGRYLNRRFNRSSCGEAFSGANEIGLVEGAGHVKLTWGPGGQLAPWTIRPAFFGVYREDIEDLDRQEAFVHSFYITPEGFRRMISRHPDRAELQLQVAMMGSPQTAADLTGDSYFHEMVTAGLGQIGYGTAASTPGYGQVALAAPGIPMLAQDVAADLIRLDDLWVWDDDRDDWTTIRMAEPGILIEGKYQRRNLGDVGPGKHPYVKVCSNRVPGYYWGRSELSTLFEPQQQINKLTDNIATIFNLRARPPRAFSGFQSLTEEKARALLAPGGQITEAAIGAKVDNLAPDMPPEALTYLDKLEDIFNDVAGFTNILSGQGEPGVRAGVHAGVLLRTSTPRLRDRALMAERQCGAFGNLVLAMLKVKDPLTLQSESGDFIMAQLPADATCSVDSHTSSPAFVDDNRQLTFALAKAEAIDGETMIEMLHPPRQDVLIARLRARQAAEAKYAAEHPELAAEAAKKK